MNQVGLIGLGTMGASFARNLASRGIKTAVFNRTFTKTEEFINEFGNEFLESFEKLDDFISSLESPRKVFVVVDAGDPVDAVIKQISPLLQQNDILVDLGNSHYKDTIRREVDLKRLGIKFIGSGMSGGKEGALVGPSLMPGGDKSAYLQIEGILQKTSAKDFSGNATVAYIGPNGAGHFVKMVHNGIEYAIMQLIAETYEILKSVLKLSNVQIEQFFQEIDKGDFEGFLFEIAAEVVVKKDDLSSDYLIDHILDSAGSKGTGKWTIEDAMNRGVYAPMVASAYFARVSSSMKAVRSEIEKSIVKNSGNKEPAMPNSLTIDQIASALKSATVAAYIEGLNLIEEASIQEDWEIDLSEVLRIWQGGCIIRNRVLEKIGESLTSHTGPARPGFSGNPVSLENIIVSLFTKFYPDIEKSTAPILEVVHVSNSRFVPTPTFSAGANFILALSQKQSSANMIQALRDRFGAHGFERV